MAADESNDSAATGNCDTQQEKCYYCKINVPLGELELFEIPRFNGGSFLVCHAHHAKLTTVWYELFAL